MPEITDRTTTTSTGTTVTLAQRGDDTVGVLDHPGVPAEMRNNEVGRVIDGGFQPAMFAPWALMPPTLRAIADLIEENTMPEQLRIIDRALWVDRGNGNLDALTGELPIWADEWAERIVAAVNRTPARVITDPDDLDTRLGRAFTIAWSRHLDDRGIDYEESADPTPADIGQLVRAAVESVGATITPAPENGDTL